MDFDPQILRIIIVGIIDDPGSSVGYRSASVWHALQQKGLGTVHYLWECPGREKTGRALKIFLAVATGFVFFS